MTSNRLRFAKRKNDARSQEKERLKNLGTEAAAQNQRTGRGKRKSKKSAQAIMAETDLHLERCSELEAQLNLRFRWTRDCDDYKAARAYYDTRQYRLNASKVKLLVTQRLMELSKCNQPHTSKYLMDYWLGNDMY
jgi:hypothetical protein